MLERFFVENKKVVNDLLDKNKPLGTYGARCDLVYLLGLINNDLHKDLKTIGKIRNEFAHSHLKMTFKDENIKKLCKKLSYADSAGDDIFKNVVHSHPRNEFTISVSQLLNILLLSGLSIKHREKNTGFPLK
jgi:DNA-binding MltR family transcriptional regulator